MLSFGRELLPFAVSGEDVPESLADRFYTSRCKDVLGLEMTVSWEDESEATALMTTIQYFTPSQDALFI